MKRLFSYTACIIALGTGSISSTALAQTTANGPYYATPSWDQTLPASTRFIVLSNFNNQAVLDRETGLVWLKSPIGRKTWSLAHADCIRSTIGNRGGWRLPTINELGSVLDPSATAGPAFPPGHPFTGFNTVVTQMWSANMNTTGDGFIHVAGWVDLGTTFVVLLGGSANPPTVSNDTWCVRGGLQPGVQ
jgi:Protein of unknown function (DUF1566)